MVTIIVDGKEKKKHSLPYNKSNGQLHASDDNSSRPKADAPVYPLQAFFSKLDALMEQMMEQVESQGMGHSDNNQLRV